MTPDSHTNPRQTKPVAVAGGKKAEQLQFSPNGSGVAVWVMPASRPTLFLTGHATLLLGPPRVRRSTFVPSSPRVAWRLCLPAALQYPATQHRLSSLLPRRVLRPCVWRV